VAAAPAFLDDGLRLPRCSIARIREIVVIVAIGQVSDNDGVGLKVSNSSVLLMTDLRAPDGCTEKVERARSMDNLRSTSALFVASTTRTTKDICPTALSLGASRYHSEIVDNVSTSFGRSQGVNSKADRTRDEPTASFS